MKSGFDARPLFLQDDLFKDLKENTLDSGN